MAVHSSPNSRQATHQPAAVCPRAQASSARQPRRLPRQLWTGLFKLTFAACVFGIGGWGCSHDDADEPDSTTKPKPGDLPELTLTDDSTDLLLTWLDEKGEFHVVQKIADVPDDAKQHVRVVQTTSANGHGDLLYVADLTAKNPDGNYRVSVMARSEWDELGASRRRKRMEALAPSASAGSPAPSASAAQAQGQLSAIVYGAEWCKPCHQAEAHLKRRGVSVIHKDIERDPAAAKEMQQKLQRAGLGAGSIPIIDLGGRMFKGFSPQALDAAIASLRKTETL